MIVGGYPDGKITEIIDVENSAFSCTKVQSFPVTLLGASGGLIGGQTPFICGGQASINGIDWFYSKDCYKPTNNGSWTKDKTASLNTRRNYAGYGSVVLNDKLVISGGSNGNHLHSIEMLSPHMQTKTLSVQLPAGFHSHCQVPLDLEKFIVIGGSLIGSIGVRRRDESYFIDVKTNDEMVDNIMNWWILAHVFDSEQSTRYNT